MAVINRSKLVKELVPGLNALFGLSYREYAPEHTQIFDVETSTKAFEEETKLVGFGAAQTRAEGQSIAYDTAQEAWTARYDHETVALGFSITEEAIDDNLYDSLARRYVKALSRSMAQTKQIKGAAVLNLAFSSSRLIGDGKPLCATDHPLASGASISNRFTVAADLNETSLDQAIQTISAWTDERGLLIAAKPVKLILPQAQMFPAERLLKSSLTPYSGDNAVNVVKSAGLLPGGYAVNHYLTDPDSWFIKTDVPDGLKMFVRKKLSTASEPGFDNMVMKYRASERYSYGVSDYMAIFGSPG